MVVCVCVYGYVSVCVVIGLKRGRILGTGVDHSETLPLMVFMQLNSPSKGNVSGLGRAKSICL